jgi:ABC-type ATPase involved in cell division/GNAT superfamily N-acetyltransferase
MFDVPPMEKCRIEWHGDIPIEANAWNVGLIVGPSGCGKSSIARDLFGADYQPELAWRGKSVVDDFSASLSMEQVTQACSAVGFNTIPAWLRPFQVLSNGERFRVELARRLLELPDPIVVDEFTSVVDRQVAQIGSHAVQKFARKGNRRFVAVSCHYDIVDWLQPDWIFEPATMTFSRRLLQRRPSLDVTIGRVPYSAWKMFAPFHYMSAELVSQARCYGLWVGKTLTTFCGVLPKPVSNGADKGTAIAGVSRVVTLPDWQGLGLAFVLMEKLGAAYGAIGKRFRNYPAHPAFVRASDRSANWVMKKKPGVFSVVSSGGGFGGRPCAVFEYCGATMPLSEAKTLLSVA